MSRFLTFLKVSFLVFTLCALGACGSSGQSATLSSSGELDNEIDDVDGIASLSEDFSVVVLADGVVTAIKRVVDGELLDKALLPENINFTVDAFASDQVGSVRLAMSGPTVIDRIENHAPYTLERESVGIETQQGGLPDGSYTITATPYSETDGLGSAGKSVSVSFTVVETSESLAVPGLITLNLVSVNDLGGYDFILTLKDGDTIDLADLAGQTIAFEAVSVDADQTGSVSIDLSGPVSVSDEYDSYPYILNLDTASNFSVDDNDLPVGTYNIVATPYELVNLLGESGAGIDVRFTVIHSETEVTEQQIEVNDDSFFIQSNSTLSRSAASGLGANDELLDYTATYSVSTNPAHGQLTIAADGSFTYAPDEDFSGSDSFDYRVDVNSASFTGSVSIQVFDNSSEEGFTKITPSSDSKIIYVSSSLGNDANSCLTQDAPCKTISNALEKLRNGFPDHIYLQRGDIWYGEDLDGITSGRSSNEPTVVAFYGDGPRPIIANTSHPMMLTYELENVHFIGLHFYSYASDPDHPDFDGESHSKIQLLGRHENILFEDNIFDLLEVSIASWDSGQPTKIVLRRNVWTGAYVNTSSYHHEKRPSNLYFSDVNGITIEENVFDYGGWHPTVLGAGANSRNHNIYVVSNNNPDNLIIRNNIIVRGSSHGIHGRPGGYYLNNFLARNSVQQGIGYGPDPLESDQFAVVENNVISETDTMYKGNPEGETATAAVWGLVISDNIGTPEFIQFSNNIITDEIAGSGIRRSYKNDSPTYTPDLENNVVYGWDGVDGGTGLIGDEAFTVPDGGYPDPDRTLATYNQSLGGDASFDDFMEIVKSRPLQTWDSNYSAQAINDYIREGFGLPKKE